MSTTSDTNITMETTVTRQIPVAPTRPFYWSVRRELWEHRSIWIAPLAVAGLVLFGFLIGIRHFAQAVRSVANAPLVEQTLKIAAPFGIGTFAICGVGLIVGFFYCLGALYNERRDRSILFWKSLPVSNVTTVLSKAFLPLVVLPLVVFAVAVVTQLIMLGLGDVVLLAGGLNPATLGIHWPMPQMIVVLAYLLAILVLWYAPICGWLLLVSSWARSMAILWAVLPWLGLGIAERIAFDTSYVFGFISFRLNGYLKLALTYHKGMSLADPFAFLTPMYVLASPGLWSGLLVTAMLLAGAVWLRRGREPA